MFAGVGAAALDVLDAEVSAPLEAAGVAMISDGTTGPPPLIILKLLKFPHLVRVMPLLVRVMSLLVRVMPLLVRVMPLLVTVTPCFPPPMDSPHLVTHLPLQQLQLGTFN